MADYMQKGYAREVSTSDNNDDDTLWYIPHHPVTNPHKPEKIRIVFDCASKYKGTSLNDNLLQGPDLTNNLIGVLTRFRQNEIAIVADIEAMFHQVRVNPLDYSALRFLWWPNGDLDAEPTDHQMLVHLFGATSSPSCCAYALQKTADDNTDGFAPETIETVKRNFYVDDCLKSVKTESEAVLLVKELRMLLSRGGFRLTKWVSNSSEVMSTIPDQELAKSVVSLDFDGALIERTLGLHWNVFSDTFEFRTVNADKPLTRRGMLSVISSLYDPLGFIAPVTLTAKHLLQELCRQKVGWDDPLEKAISDQWLSWIQDLPTISELNVGRCFKPRDISDDYQVHLHHFADASERGYGAVSYLRFVDTQNNISCSFVIGKSRLSPLKTVSIPRLELSAAVVAVKLNRMLQHELDVHIHETYYWTDSMTVLQYIENENRRFKTFVSNRLSVIHELSDSSQWRYVNTADNPADYASRGLKAHETENLDVWLKGPSFLWKTEKYWPKRPSHIPKLPDDSPELKREATVNVAKENLVENTGLDRLITSHCSWYALQKSIAWLLRYKEYCCEKYMKRTYTTKPNKLTVGEIKVASDEIIKYVQRKTFQEEISALQQQGSGKHKLSKSFAKLSPVIENGMIRVGGRLDRAFIHYDAKHPAILPNKHPVTQMIIRYYHCAKGHCGQEQVLSSMRQRYWVLKGRTAVRKTLGDCFQCKRRRAPLGEQFMASLPKERLIPDSPPFTNVGVDYFGPMYIKQKRSVAKRYGCLFTCLSSRAVHIEIAHSLDTDSFLSALARFTSRRGQPKAIFSDNGTNFTGAQKELRESLNSWNESKIDDTLRQSGIEWHFNPPAASHMGGIWERIIRSTKNILKSLLKEQLVSDETLLTFMAEVERILNDRPLTKVSDDIRDLKPITPNTILLLKPSSSMPPGTFTPEDRYVKRWWRQAQYLANVFWKRWLKEYVPSLQERQKWLVNRRNMRIGDIVLVATENCPRGQWPLAQVTETYPDGKGYVRSVKVRTGTTCKVRPITKLCMLEGTDSNEPEGSGSQAHVDDSGRMDDNGSVSHSPVPDDVYDGDN